jgi:hypothetical protein
MKNRLLLIAFFCSLLVCPTSCKKIINQQKENVLTNLVTSGTWRVTRYVDQQTDITDSFAGYVFQFNSNGTVEGILNGQTTAGTWVGDVNARTIQSDFPNAGDPLKELNYTWQITDSYTDSVSARTAVDSSYNYLELHKN